VHCLPHHVSISRCPSGSVEGFLVNSSRIIGPAYPAVFFKAPVQFRSKTLTYARPTDPRSPARFPLFFIKILYSSASHVTLSPLFSEVGSLFPFVKDIFPFKALRSVSKRNPDLLPSFYIQISRKDPTVVFVLRDFVPLRLGSRPHGPFSLPLIFPELFPASVAGSPFPTLWEL